MPLRLADCTNGGKLRAFNMPSTFIIKRGIVKHVHVGYFSGDIEKLEMHINKELKR